MTLSLNLSSSNELRVKTNAVNRFECFNPHFVTLQSILCFFFSSESVPTHIYLSNTFFWTNDFDLPPHVKI